MKFLKTSCVYFDLTPQSCGIDFPAMTCKTDIHIPALQRTNKCLFAVFLLQYSLPTNPWIISEAVQIQWVCKEAVTGVSYIKATTRTSFSEPGSRPYLHFAFSHEGPSIQMLNSQYPGKDNVYLIFLPSAHTVPCKRIVVSICIYTYFCNSKLSQSSD